MGEVSEFSLLLNRYVHQQGYSIRSLAKLVDIPAATLTKLCNGTRSPVKQRDNIRRIADVLMLTPAQREKLYAALEKEIIGAENYTSRMMIKSLIEGMNGFTLTEQRALVRAKLPAQAFAEKQSDVYMLLRAFLENAALGASMDLMLSPDDPVVIESLCRMVKGSTVKIRHIVAMVASDGKTGRVSSQNIDSLSKIQPLLLGAAEKLNLYQLYYYYERTSAVSSNVLYFPNVLISERGVLQCSADYSRAVFTADGSTCKYYRRLFAHQVSNCRTMITIYDDVRQQLMRYSHMMRTVDPGDALRALSWQPCLLWALDPREVSELLAGDIPFRRDYLELYLPYLQKLQERRRIDLFFSQEGLVDFARGGSPRELPESFLDAPLPAAFRVELLHRMWKQVQAGRVYPRIVREEKMRIGHDAQLISYGSDTIVLSILNHQVNNRVCFIEELSANWGALDFLENLENTDWLLSVEETCEVIREVIETIFAD